MTTLKEWEASTGPVCPECGREFFQGHDGLCMECWRKKKDNEVEYRISEGLIGLVPDVIPMVEINRIVHEAKR